MRVCFIFKKVRPLKESYNSFVSIIFVNWFIKRFHIWKRLYGSLCALLSAWASLNVFSSFGLNKQMDKSKYLRSNNIGSYDYHFFHTFQRGFSSKSIVFSYASIIDTFRNQKCISTDRFRKFKTCDPSNIFCFADRQVFDGTKQCFCAVENFSMRPEISTN